MAGLSNSFISPSVINPNRSSHGKSNRFKKFLKTLKANVSRLMLGSSTKLFNQSTKLFLGQSQNLVGNAQLHTSKRKLCVQAEYSERSIGGSAFVGGFVLGGLIVGTLGCVYAPQISKALAGADKKELLKKLPAFIYDEEKALEKTRKKLTEKIAQLNDAIDDVSSQLKSDDENSHENGAIVPEKSQSVA